jgi:hypothetical protein
MTAEMIVKTVLNVINLRKDVSNLSSTDNDFIQIKAFLNETGVELSRRVRWDKLIKTELTIGNVDNHILPSDYQQLSLSGGIVLNKANYIPCRLITSKALWQSIKAGTSLIYYAIINDNKIEFSKTLDSDGAKFYYFSNNWIVGNKNEIIENSDIPLIPESLLSKGAIWRWKREKGLPYTDELAEYEALIATESEASKGL